MQHPNIWNDRDLIKKILITLAVVVGYRIGFLIPIPGLNLEVVREFLGRIARPQGDALFQVLYAFGGGAMDRFNIFALGLMPYFSSCILIQLLSILVPFLKRYYYGGTAEQNRERLVRHTYYATFALGMLQAFFFSLWLENPDRFSGIDILALHGWPLRILVMASLTAGIALTLWLAALITKHGIGNGVAILFISAIVIKLPMVCYRIVQLLSYYGRQGERLLFEILVAAAGIALFWLVTKSTEKIPITFRDSGTKNQITLRLTWTGEQPLVLAQSLILFPATLLAMKAGFSGKLPALSQNSLFFLLGYSFLVIFFTYFYMAVVFWPRSIADKMLRYRCQIDDVAPGQNTARYLDAKLTKKTALIALFLVGLAILPQIYQNMFQLPYLVAGFMAGTSLVLMLGVVYDLKSQIESYFKMKADPNVERWEMVETTLDEIEAEIKEGFLKSNNIPCVIEPLRFTWGMPIKTSVDQYRLYVPSLKREEAKKILAT